MDESLEKTRNMIKSALKRHGTPDIIRFTAGSGDGCALYQGSNNRGGRWAAFSVAFIGAAGVRERGGHVSKSRTLRSTMTPTSRELGFRAGFAQRDATHDKRRLEE